MPRIQEYQIRAGVADPDINASRRASGDAFGAGIAQGIGQIGQTLGSVADQLYEYEERKQAFEAKKLATQARTDWLRWVNDAANPADDEGKAQQEEWAAKSGALTQHFDDSFRHYKEVAVSTLTSVNAQRILEADLDATHASVLGDILRLDTALYGRTQRLQLTEMFNGNNNLVYGRPELLGEISQAETDLIRNAPFLDENMRAQLIRERTVSRTNSALDGRIDRVERMDGVTVQQIDALIEEMKVAKSVWVADTSPEAYASALTRLDSLRKAVTSRKKQQAFLDFDDDMKILELTGVDNGRWTPGQINALVEDESQRERMLKRRGEASAVAREVRSAAGVPLNESAARVEAMFRALPSAPKSGEALAALQAAQTVLNRRAEAFRQDPVAFALGESKLAQAKFDAFSKKRTPEAAAEYANTIMLEQLRLAPGTSPALLSKGQIGSIAAKLEAIPGTEDGAPRALAAIQAEMAVWGDKWPLVVRDLRAEKVLNDAQYVAASMYNKPRRQHIAEDLIRASAIDPEKLARSIQGTGAQSRAREAAQGALADLREPLSGMVDGVQIYQAYENALTQLLLYRGVVKGQDVTEIAGDLANQIVKEDYKFQGGYMVPQDQDAAAIASGTEGAKLELDKLDLALPSSLAGIREEDIRDEYLRRVRQNGRFVNTGDGTGLALVDENMDNVMVKRNGRSVPLKWTWEELRGMRGASTLPPVLHRAQDRP